MDLSMTLRSTNIEGGRPLPLTLYASTIHVIKHVGHKLGECLNLEVGTPNCFNLLINLKKTTLI